MAGSIDCDHLQEYKFDRWGHPINTKSDACILHINAYYEQVLSYGAKRDIIMRAIQEDGESMHDLVKEVTGIDFRDLQQDLQAAKKAAIDVIYGQILLFILFTCLDSRRFFWSPIILLTLKEKGEEKYAI